MQSHFHPVKCDGAKACTAWTSWNMNELIYLNLDIFMQFDAWRFVWIVQCRVAGGWIVSLLIVWSGWSNANSSTQATYACFFVAVCFCTGTFYTYPTCTHIFAWHYQRCCKINDLPLALNIICLCFSLPFPPSALIPSSIFITHLCFSAQSVSSCIKIHFATFSSSLPYFNVLFDCVGCTCICLHSWG